MSCEDILQDKWHCLIKSIKQYEKAAVAYSGGVDSTLLLYAAKEALGGANVVALTLVSPVLPEQVLVNCRAIVKEPLFTGISHKEISAEPLEWEDFVENSTERCYLCKKKMYSLLTESMRDEAQYVLIDGTNVDDTAEDRPGHKALQELGIKTPLLYAGFQKKEIRKLAREIGLSNHNLPSNSCLATRIQTGLKIDAETLKLIDRAESFLLKIGFSGCRVKPRGSYVIIELQAADMEKIVTSSNRKQITSYFYSLKLGDVALSFNHR